MVASLSVGRIVVATFVVVVVVVAVVFAAGAAARSDGPKEMIAFIGLTFSTGDVFGRPSNRFDRGQVDIIIYCKVL
jgi:hypothetical protein